ncbi:MAG: sugar ABC transporter permease [Firmicutes bacterium]|jgi:sn-glycerol 3-phosphate transport system permease protein|nr:sugar ABC transporter permease [Bacillota bacterium]
MRLRSGIIPYLYIMPALLILIVFLYWPLIFNLILSFMRWDLVSPVRLFVGLQNYAEMWSRESFRWAALNSLKYFLGILPFSVLLPLGLATVLSGVRKDSTRRVYETVMFMPTMLSFAVACFIWIWMFNPIGGVISRLLQALGLPTISWLSDHRYSLIAVVIVSGWRVVGYYLVLFAAALLAIPEEYVEAAKIDGANGWQVFWRIKWPLISPTTFFVTVTTVINASSDTFVPIHLLTRGGPYNSSNNLIYLVYQYAFQFFNAGLAGATAVVVFGIFIAATLLHFFLGERFVHYE